MSTESKESPAKMSSFTIEHILKHAGENSKSESNSLEYLSWLHCTRYCPPKLGCRKQKRGDEKIGVVRRQLGRHPRIPFSSTQVSILESQFKETPYLSSAQVNQLSKLLDLADVRIKIWFQNRRARERREQSQASSSQGTNTSPELPNDPPVNQIGFSPPTQQVFFPVLSSQHSSFIKLEPSSPEYTTQQMHEPSHTIDPHYFLSENKR